jgi:hypothetical protein
MFLHYPLKLDTGILDEHIDKIIPDGKYCHDQSRILGSLTHFCPLNPDSTGKVPVLYDTVLHGRPCCA